MIASVIISYELIVSIIAGLLAMAVTLFTTISYVRKKSEKELRERYDFNKHIVELEYMRKNLEMQLYDVSRKLEENDKRWKDINHLIITSQNKQTEVDYKKSKVLPNDFLKSLGIENPKDFEVDDKHVFVLTPFNDNYRETFFSIKAVCDKLNLKCLRGDEEYIPNDVFPTILRHIIRSRFLIANITGRNPNVMYELGLAHAFGKPTIIISQNFTDIPFDLNNKRIIIYDTNADLKIKLESSISDMLINNLI